MAQLVAIARRPRILELESRQRQSQHRVRQVRVAAGADRVAAGDQDRVVVDHGTGRGPHGSPARGRHLIGGEIAAAAGGGADDVAVVVAAVAEQSAIRNEYLVTDESERTALLLDLRVRALRVDRSTEALRAGREIERDEVVAERHGERHDVQQPAPGVGDGRARDAGRVDVPARELRAGDGLAEMLLPLDLARRGVERVHVVAFGGDEDLVADEEWFGVHRAVEPGRLPHPAERPRCRTVRFDTGAQRVAVVGGPRPAGRLGATGLWRGRRGRPVVGLRLRVAPRGARGEDESNDDARCEEPSAGHAPPNLAGPAGPATHEEPTYRGGPPREARTTVRRRWT